MRADPATLSSVIKAGSKKKDPRLEVFERPKSERLQQFLAVSLK